MTKCKCLADDEQSDPAKTTERFCGRESNGVKFGCSADKCSGGCPTLNQPAPKDTDTSKKVPSKKKHKKKTPPPPKQSHLVWWLIGGFGFLILIGLVAALAFRAGQPVQG